MRRARGWKAVLSACLTVVFAAGGLAISTTVASAARPTVAGTVPLPASVLSQQAGTATGVTVVNYTTGPVGAFPGLLGDDVDLQFHGVTDTSATAVSSASGLLAAFCGNRDTVANRPLIAADFADPTAIGTRCSDPGPPLGASAHLSVTYGGSPGEIVVSGTLDSLPAGNACVPNQVLPCQVLLGSLTQTVVLILPLIYPTAASVVGPLALAGTVCNPASAPPTGCPVTRVTDETVPSMYPVAIGGAGFPSAAQIPTAVAAPISLTLCNLDTSSCGALFGSFLPTGANPFLPISGTNPANPGIAAVTLTGVTAGRFQGAYLFESGAPAVPGQYLIRVTATYLNGSLAPITQFTQYAYVRILSTPTATLSATSGPPGTVTNVQGTGFEPRQNVEMYMLDQNGFAFPLHADVAPQTSTTDGEGNIVQGAGTAFTPNFPAAKIRVRVGGNPDTVAEPFVQQDKVFDSTGAITYCNDTGDTGACTNGIIVVQDVQPGTLQEQVSENNMGDGGGPLDDSTTQLSDIDLSSILLNDPDTWYPLSDPTTLPRITVGDFRGGNTGWVVTAQSSDLIGSIQPANVIPAFDLWASNAQCDLSTIDGVDAMGGDLDIGYGDISTGPDDSPDPATESVLSDGSQDICDLNPNADGLAAGIFDMQFDVQVGGRPTTAADEFVGLITVTVTGN